ncbi:SGNH/GDSL hydrolase family protein [Empedobacter tilapiae]
MNTSNNWRFKENGTANPDIILTCGANSVDDSVQILIQQLESGIFGQVFIKGIEQQGDVVTELIIGTTESNIDAVTERRVALMNDFPDLGLTKSAKQEDLNKAIVELVKTISLSAGAGLYEKGITPTSEVPDVESKVFTVTIPGTYTNFGGVNLPDGHFGFIFKDGGSFSIQTLDIPMQDLSNIENQLIKNQFDIDNLVNFAFILDVTGIPITGNYINNSGSVVSANNWECSKLIPIEYNKEYLYEGRTTLDNGTASAAQAIVAFNSNGTFHSVILSSYNSAVSGKYSFEITNSNISFIRISSRIGFDFRIFTNATKLPSERVENLSELKKDFDKLVSGVIDLTGFLTGAYINSSGVAVTIGTWVSTDFISVKNEKEYLYEGKTSLGSGTAYAIVGYNSSREKVSSILYSYDSTTSGIFKFKISDPNISYIRACSHITVQLKLHEVSDKIPKDRVEGLIALEKTVKELSESTGIGPIVSGQSWASIGDSITAFDQTNKGYQSFIKEKISFTSYSNQGYSGRSLTMAGDRSSILEGIANIGAYDLYTIAAGTNDFRLDRPIGTTSDYINNTGATTFYGALRATIDLLYNKRPSCKIYIFSPLRRNNADYTSFSTNNAGHKLSDYRDALAWVANHEALTFLDLFNDSGITDRNLSLYTSDGLHPTTLGHSVISKRMINEMKLRI